jgi:hypothetical protein
MRKIFFMCLLVPLLMAMPVSGEYYQYEDAEGNLRFTDDPANIPRDTQADITAYESIENNSFQEPLELNSSDSTQEDGGNLSLPGASKSEQIADRKELDEMRAALDQTEALLKAEHEELKMQAPGLDASTLQKNEYAEKITVMNAKMADYKEQHQAYNEKARAYNASIQSEEKKVDNANVE